ncbi:unnamed protein product [Peniophora sp. CBMAI 1063]|nr:unnamed protein product [Peniophora sp. CBMAI 1063]
MSDISIPEKLNAVYVFTTEDLGYACDPLKDRDSLREHLDGLCLAVDENDRFLQHELQDVFLTPRYQKIASFFDRDPTVLEWYYAMYALTDSKDEPVNTVASVVCGKEKPKGPVIIVKDGPASKWGSFGTDVDVDEVAKTLWYYHKSGTSVEAEFGERTLLRILSA